MRIEAIASGKNPPEDVNVIIEVPIGGEPIKYEMDKEAGTLFVDRFLHTSMRYPGNYGFVPHTLSGDGDPIDVLVCNTRALVPGCVINVRPIGVLVMEDNAGQDEKIIAVPSPKLTLRYENVTEYTQLPEITRQQVQHFFEHYKDLEPGKWVKIEGWHDAATRQEDDRRRRSRGRRRASSSVNSRPGRRPARLPMTRALVLAAGESRAPFRRRACAPGRWLAGLPVASTRPTVQPSRASIWPTLATTSTSVGLFSSSGLLIERRWMAAKGTAMSPLVSMRHSTLAPAELKPEKLSQTDVMSPPGGKP